jgi:ketosteroid isomerase-like protein
MTPGEDEVIAANEAFYRAFNEKDPEAMERAWASADNLSCVHPGWNVLRGRQAVLDSWRGILGNASQPRIVVGGADVTLLGDVAVVICRELVAASPLAATNVFVREEGAWKLLHHQSGPVASFG